jgi:hypothetical protein
MELGVVKRMPTGFGYAVQATFYRSYLDSHFPGMGRRDQILAAARDFAERQTSPIRAVFGRLDYDTRRDAWSVWLEL